MANVDELIIIVDAFSSDAHWNYRLVKIAKDMSSLLNEAENYDIKDEDLFQQFESFMSAYKELVDTLSVSSDSLDPESFEDAGQLIDTLKKRYERIMNNPYLNLDEGWQEDFDPGTFTQLLSDIAQDAENKLKAAAGEDIDISEMRAAQYANEFNKENFEQAGVEGDKNLRWTGDKVRQGLEAKKQYFENLMVLKKLDINHPQYQNYIQSRRRSYQAIMSDPEKKMHYRNEAKERQAKYTKKFTIRKNEIEKLLKSTSLGPTRRQELQEELNRINSQKEKLDVLREKSNKKKREKIESNSFEGLTAKFITNIANVKMGIKKSITAKLRLQEDTTFKSFKDALVQAELNHDEAGKVAAAKALQKALNKAAESDEALVNYTANSLKYTEFKKMLDIVHTQGWMNPETSLEDIRPHLQMVLDEGNKLLADNTNAIIFKSPNNTLKDILHMITTRLASQNDFVARTAGQKRMAHLRTLLA